MRTSTDTWWDSNPTSAELSRHAAHRSAVTQAVAGGRRRRRIGLPRWVVRVRAARSTRTECTTA
jgi:hypothetical protein